MIETVSPFSLSIADLGVLSPFLRSETRQRRARPLEKRVTSGSVAFYEAPTASCAFMRDAGFGGNARFTVFFTIVSLVVEVALDNL
ncbi:hypothetical protein NDU88_003878 [Pleurodeles waltl]|uniref:Uncharacterized protein n=1 Tax=Pleurodeles waltl TaxID=8319 RepID=A0AAV7VHB0_PLEWA|nr:hypothetical protein NDU88_003878 [Pleurodeles waltl]